jgi:hypothetical protein
MQDEVFIGVDVAKHEVVCAINGQPQVGCVPNDAASLSAWLQQALAALAELAKTVDRQVQQRVLADPRMAEPY